MTARWKHRPDGSTWGDFGADDQLGRINLLTPAKVLEGVREVRDGRTFALSLPLDYPGGSALNPKRFPPQLQPTLESGCPCFNFPLFKLDGRNTDIISDDKVTIWLQYSTQWDSLAHYGTFFDVMGDGRLEKVYYNGFRANEHIVGPMDYQPDGTGKPVQGPYGARALDIANFARAGLQGRAVMFDLKKHFGMTRRYVGLADLLQVMDADGIEVRPGDMLLFRTGWTEVLMTMNKQPDKARLDETGAVLDGRDADLLRWITDRQVVALCADNFGVEGIPARETLGRRPALPLHQHCIFKLGVPLGEFWWLADLADWMAGAGRTACLLTAPPLNLPGAVGSPATPIATV